MVILAHGVTMIGVLLCPPALDCAVTSDRKLPRTMAFLRSSTMLLIAVPILLSMQAAQAQPMLLAPVQSTISSGLEQLPVGDVSGPLVDVVRGELSSLNDVGLAGLVKQGLLPLEAALRELPAAEQLWLSMPLGNDLQSQQQIAEEASLLIAQLRHWQAAPVAQQRALVSGVGVERARPEGGMDPVVSIARQVRLIASRLFSAAHDAHERIPRGLDSLLAYTQDRVQQFQADQVLVGAPLLDLMESLSQQMQGIDKGSPSGWAALASSLHQGAVQLENMAGMQDSRSMQQAMKRLRSKLPMTETGRAWRAELDRALALLAQQGWVDVATMNSLLADWEMLAEAH